MPVSWQNKAIFGNDYVSNIGHDGVPDSYSCCHCRYKTLNKAAYHRKGEPVRNAINRVRADIMRHVRDNHL